MIILLDTSTPVCRLSLVDGESRFDYEWEAGRQLAKELHRYLGQKMSEHHRDIKDITAIGVLAGPGSFTGLRIGLTVMNTLASSLKVPIVGVMGENWTELALDRLKNGENDEIVMPYYGAEANVTRPRK